MRYKRPDKKNALSLVEATQRDMKYTLSLEITDDSGTTIIRNFYECFRMLGDSLLVSRGIESEDHVTPIRELMKLKIKTERPIYLIDNLRRLRHNINYYGYKPIDKEVKEIKIIAKTLFEPLKNAVLKKINNRANREVE